MSTGGFVGVEVVIVVVVVGFVCFLGITISVDFTFDFDRVEDAGAAFTLIFKCSGCKYC